jgi:hypothetical protein
LTSLRRQGPAGRFQRIAPLWRGRAVLRRRLGGRRPAVDKPARRPVRKRRRRIGGSRRVGRGRRGRRGKRRFGRRRPGERRLRERRSFGVGNRRWRLKRLQRARGPAVRPVGGPHAGGFA